jgi:TrmH family RNA methyltransferase
VTIVDGHDELVLALDSGARPAAVYWCEALVRDPAQLAVLSRAAALGAEIVRLTRPVFEKVAYREAPDGWLAVVPFAPTPLAELAVPEQPLLLVCDAVEKPGNLGAMLRTAEAAGVDAVVASPGVTDWGNPNVVRASKGTVFAVPVAEAGRAELITWLRDHRVRIVAASPSAAVPYTAADLRGGAAIVVGSETAGLSDEWLAAADAAVGIPMHGRVNSLNVSTSAALLVYEAVRQRAMT